MLHEFSKRVFSSLKKKKEDISGSIAVALLVAQIVIECLKLYFNCKKNRKEIRDSIQNPTPREKIFLKWVLTRKLGRLKFKQFGEPLMEEILENAKTLTDEELAKIIDDVVKSP